MNDRCFDDGYVDARMDARMDGWYYEWESKGGESRGKSG